MGRNKFAVSPPVPPHPFGVGKRVGEGGGQCVFLWRAGRLEVSAELYAAGHNRCPVEEAGSYRLACAVAEAGQAVVIPDKRTHPLFGGAPPARPGAAAGLPLEAGGQVVGVLSVCYSLPGEPAEGEVRLLRLLADEQVPLIGGWNFRWNGTNIGVSQIAEPKIGMV